MAGFRWNTKREEAALLVAEDTLTNEQIAQRVGVTRQALDKWKAHPDFRARVEQHLTTFRERIVAEGIASRQNRVAALNDRWRRMQRVIDERGEHAQMQEVPGGRTGLLVHQTKAIGTGANQTIIDEYVFDAALVRELRAHEEQAAKELGQWTEKSEQSGDVQVRVVYDDDAHR